MPIWFKNYSVEKANNMGKGTLFEHLGIKITSLEDTCIVGRMPIEDKVRNPFGTIHGGAMIAMAEELSGLGSNLVVDCSLEYCVGIEINANHISSAFEGVIIGKSSPLHLGKATHVWETRIYNNNKLLSIGRMTMMILKNKPIITTRS